MNRRIPNRRLTGKKNKRFGSAVVEFTLSIPLIMLVVFGSIEVSNAIYLQQVVTEVAYIGALEGIRKDATETEITNRMQDYVDQTSVTGVTYGVAALDGSAYSGVTSGQPFVVTVTAPTETMSISMQLFSGFENVSGSRIASKQ